jgi:hypothetical protein
MEFDVSAEWVITGRGEMLYGLDNLDYRQEFDYD